MKEDNLIEDNQIENKDRNKKATVDLVDKLKFVELHFHLDGSITPEIALRLSKIQDISLPTEDLGKLKELLEVPKDCQSLVEFLNHFEIPSKLLQTKIGISECVYYIQEEYKKNNGIYLEMRFAPQFHCFKGLTQKEVIEAALEGLRKSDFHANLILCLMRFGDNKKANEETIRLAKEFLVEDNGVVGVDIAGDELGNPILNYKKEFELIQKLGIPYTIHAGEADGAVSVENSLDLGAKRIGHGFRAAESENIISSTVEVMSTLSPTNFTCGWVYSSTSVVLPLAWCNTSVCACMVKDTRQVAMNVSSFLIVLFCF